MPKSLFHKFVSRYRKNKVVSFLLQKTGRISTPAKWVFIVGCYNSGTTLLEQVMSLHPDVSTLGDEGVILTNQLNRPEDFGYNRVWYPVADKLYIDPDNLLSAEKAEVIKRHWSHFFDLNKKVFVEKSIANSVRIDFFHKYFAPAYFIYIVRNGYAVAEGISRKANPHKFKKPALLDYSLDISSTQWRESDLTIRRSLVGKKFTTVSYEDLTENTSRTVKSIFEFLNMAPPREEVLKHSFNVHGSVSEIRNMNNSSFKKLSPEQIHVIKNHAGEVLTYYNYLL